MDFWLVGKRCSLYGQTDLHRSAVLAALAMIAAPAAKAGVVETFNLSGNFGSLFGPLVPFTGTVKLDFSNDFTNETLTSIKITVQGRPVFNQSVSLSVTPSVGVIGASNSAGDTLALLFAAPQSGTWAGFAEGDVSFGDVFLVVTSGVLLGATGKVTRDGPVILAPILDPPPPITYPPTRLHGRRSRALDLDDAAARPRGPRSRGEASACVGLSGRKSLSNPLGAGLVRARLCDLTA